MPIAVISRSVGWPLHRPLDELAQLVIIGRKVALFAAVHDDVCRKII